MGNKADKTEHVGSKKGEGAYWGVKKNAKRESNRQRRRDNKSLSEENELEALDTFDYHEAMERTHDQIESLKNTLGRLPAVTEEKDAQKIYQKALEDLAELYRLLQRLHSER